jgi:hypothetical protein
MDWNETIRLVGPAAGAVISMGVLFALVLRYLAGWFERQTAQWQQFMGNHMSSTTDGLKAVTGTLERLCERQERIGELVQGCPKRRSTDGRGE